MLNLNDYRSGILNPDNLPTLDLHGEIGDIARVKINDFIKDHQKMRNRFVCIIHGVSGGVIKSVTNDTLKRHKQIVDFGMIFRNPGSTVIEIKLK